MIKQNYNQNKILNIFSLFLISLFLYLIMFPFQWTDNEFMYFGMAEFYHLNNMENYSFFHTNKTKFPFGYLHGKVINLFGYDYAWFFGRFFLIAIYFLSLLSFTKSIKIKPYILLISLVIFYLLKQNFFLGGEWFFQGFESRAFCYIIFLFSFELLIKKKFKIFLSLNIISFYFHFLTGFYSFMFLILFYLIYSKNLKNILYLLIAYFVFCFPLILIGLIENFQVSEIDHDYIYHKRVEHLVSAFDESNMIFRKHLLGYLLIFASSITLLFIKFKFNPFKEKNMFLESLLASSLLVNLYFFLVLIIDYFDTNHFFSKFYLYRPGSYALLIQLLIILSFFLNYLNKKFIKLLIVLIIISPIFHSKINIYNIAKVSLNILLRSFDEKIVKLNNDELELINWVKKNSDPKDIFLIEETYTTKNINIRVTGFEQNVKRPTVVNEHHVYGSQKDIQRWHKLIVEKRKIFEGNCDNKIINYKFLVFFDKKNKENFLQKCKSTIVFENSSASILKII